MKKFNFHYGWVILAIGTMVVAGSLGFGRFSYSMILPSMQKGLALSDAQAGLIGSANMFGYFLAALIAGMLASKYGGRLVITVSLLWVAVTMAATALVNGIASLMLLRFLTGIGSAGANISIMGLCAGWFAPNRRGIASGVLVGGSGVAMAVTGFIVPRINALDPVSGWRLNWLIIAGLVGILGAAAMIFVRNSPIGMGLTPIGAKGKKTAQEKERMTFKDMVAIPQMRKIILLYFCFGMSYIIYATFFVPYLVTEKGLSEALAGSIWSMVGLLSIGSAVIWGALSDLIGRRQTLGIVFVLQASSYFLLVPDATSLILIKISAVIFGLVAWSVPAIVASYCGDLVGTRYSSAAIGLVTFFFGLGQVIGPVSAGLIREFNHSYTGAFLLATSLAALGAIISITAISYKERKDIPVET